MAVSSPAIPNLHAVPSANAGFSEKLNTRWHERALQVFMFVVLAHWAEHLVQAYQIYAMHLEKRVDTLMHGPLVFTD